MSGILLAIGISAAFAQEPHNADATPGSLSIDWPERDRGRADLRRADRTLEKIDAIQLGSHVQGIA
jgi:hypothetical protein